MWIAFVAKQMNTVRYPFYDLLPLPLKTLMSIGPAQSSPLCKNGLVLLTLDLGRLPINCVFVSALCLKQVVHLCTRCLTAVSPLVIQYCCRRCACVRVYPPCSVRLCASSIRSVVKGPECGIIKGCFCVYDSSAYAIVLLLLSTCARRETNWGIEACSAFAPLYLSSGT